MCFLLPVTPIHEVGPASPSSILGVPPEAASTSSPLPIKADIQRVQLRSLSLFFFCLLGVSFSPFGMLRDVWKSWGGGVKREMPGE